MRLFFWSAVNKNEMTTRYFPGYEISLVNWKACLLDWALLGSGLAVMAPFIFIGEWVTVVIFCMLFIAGFTIARMM